MVDLKEKFPLAVVSFTIFPESQKLILRFWPDCHICEIRGMDFPITAIFWDTTLFIFDIFIKFPYSIFYSQVAGNFASILLYLWLLKFFFFINFIKVNTCVL